MPEATYEQFEAGGITVGTVKDIKQEQDSHQAIFIVDFSETIGEKTFIIQNLSPDIVYQLPTQILVSVNKQMNEIVPLVVIQDNDRRSVILLGVDRPVSNGGELL